MHKNIKTTLMILIVPALIAVFFFDNIRGYYRFKELCAEHKELVVYQKLEPNVGWQANLKEYENNGSVMEKLYFIPYIKFYRFNDYVHRQLYDTSYIGSKRLPWLDGQQYIPGEAQRQIKDESNYKNGLASLEKNQYINSKFLVKVSLMKQECRAGVIASEI